MNEELVKYRDLLIEIEGKAQEDFDKTVLSLSGGALGISFAFIKDIVGDDPLIFTGYLIAAWVVWASSVTCVLSSYFFSQQALRKTIKQIDQGAIYSETTGGAFSKITAILNAAGGLLFLAGVILIVIFAFYNLR
jgi:hypothetical protein